MSPTCAAQFGLTVYKVESVFFRHIYSLICEYVLDWSRLDFGQSGLKLKVWKI